MLETENLAALRVNSGHHMFDRAIFPRRIHRLEDHQQRVRVGGVQKLLQRAQLIDMLSQQLSVLLLRLVNRLHHCRPFAQVDGFALADPKVLDADLHGRLLSHCPTLTDIATQGQTGHRVGDLCMRVRHGAVAMLCSEMGPTPLWRMPR